MEKKQRALLAASVAGLLAAAGASTIGIQSAQAADGHCYGINKCKGTGACGGQGHSCAGQNGCQGQAWLDIDEETCLKIKGGRLTEEVAEEAADEADS